MKKDQCGMHVLGITGGIGSGKSEVLKILGEEPGSYILEADRLAHELMTPGHICYREIVEHFGQEILAGDGTIDRGKLGTFVMQSPEGLKALNDIVHPAVKRSIRSRIRRRAAGGIRLFVIEAALLIQDGYRDICDEIWYIHVEKEQRIGRLLAGRGGSREKWEAFIANQPEDAFFRKNSDVTIENQGSFPELRTNIRREVQRLFLKYMGKSATIS